MTYIESNLTLRKFKIAVVVRTLVRTTLKSCGMPDSNYACIYKYGLIIYQNL